MESVFTKAECEAAAKANGHIDTAHLLIYESENWPSGCFAKGQPPLSLYVNVATSSTTQASWSGYRIFCKSTGPCAAAL